MRLLAFRDRDGERGQALVILALTLSGMLLAVGLAFDAGMLYSARRSAQAATDAAAWAGAVALYKGLSQSAARDAAFVDASRNEFANGGATTVSVWAPPASGPYAGDPRAVEVVVTRGVRTTFLNATGLSRIQTRAVSAALPVSSGHAILALNRSVPEGFRADGNGSLIAVGGGVMVDSNNAQAAVLNGRGSTVDQYTNVVGGTYQNGLGSFTPAPVTNATIAPDPYKTLPTPSVNGLPVFRNVRVRLNSYLDPGVYEGGITVFAGGVAHLQPGIYILKGGGLSVSGNGSIHNDAVGVMFFATHSNYPGGPGVCGDVSITGNGEVRLEAMQSGVYAGILFFQDRACTDDFTLAGNGSLTSIVGTIYAPTALVRLVGNGTAELAYTTQVIGDTVKWAGNGNITLTHTAGQLARPILPTLVE